MSVVHSQPSVARMSCDGTALQGYLAHDRVGWGLSVEGQRLRVEGLGIRVLVRV